MLVLNSYWESRGIDTFTDLRGEIMKKLSTLVLLIGLTTAVMGAER